MPNEDRLDDLLLRWEELYEQGQDVPADRLCGGCPELGIPLAGRIAELKRVGWLNTSEATGASPPGTPSSEAFVPPLETLGGRYRLEEVLGEGGFGQVWRAFDTELHRHVAVKVSKRCGAAKPGRFDALVSEARRVARLKHPGIVPVFDAGRHGESYFVVSELIDGIDLGVRMRQGRLPIWESLRIVAAVAYALEEAHRRAIVHQDIKPANVLLGANGQVYLTDFGIAATKEELGRGKACTSGTLAYMSPEQSSGERSLIDARSDVYALGVMLCELVTGLRPPPAIDTVRGRGPLPSGSLPSGVLVPSFLNEVWRKCMAREAADRYATARELADHLSGAAVVALEEEEWAVCTDPLRMIRQVHECAPPRIMRLFVSACVRLSYPSIEDQRSRVAIEAAERHADGEATDAELAAVNAGAWEARYEHRTPQAAACAWATHGDVWTAVFNAGRYAEPGLQCRLLRELFGSSVYRPLFRAASWNDNTVRSIAQGIYDDRAFDRLPVLADALEEAGCHNADLVSHCRRPGGHARGCWAVDSLLGKR